jgi:hypothetical protein
MKNKLITVILAAVMLIIAMNGAAFAGALKSSDENSYRLGAVKEVENTIGLFAEQSEEDLYTPYAFVISSNPDKKMRVQFVGSQMYHDDRYLGFGLSGRPMLSLRYMSEWFGFRVDYDVESSTVSVGNGEYSFRVRPGGSAADIYWAGEKINEYELTESALFKDNRLYLYSLDISDLLGLMPYWDDSTRTWDVLYRDYIYQELGFSTHINDDLFAIKGLLFDDGQHNTPHLHIKNIDNDIRSHTSSLWIKEFGTDSIHMYDISSSIRLNEETNRLRVSLSLGQRIIFVKDIDVTSDIEAKELVVADPSYEFTSPTQGYIKVAGPEMLISGSVVGIDDYCPAEIVLFVRKVDDTEIMLNESIPVTDGRFMYELKLEKGEGLYKVTVNYVMPAPRGPAYPEITNFYVEYTKQLGENSQS